MEGTSHFYFKPVLFEYYLYTIIFSINIFSYVTFNYI